MAESDFVVNEGPLGFGPIIAVCIERRPSAPRVADGRGDDEMVRHGFGAARASRERGVIRRAGGSYFDASTTKGGNGSAIGAKRLGNNGLGI